ncbi:MAG: C-terminal helicase domain-containing protein, partial [Verrucomicrobia bacterium]|nr:C-terminal helicase domain-containing protein [Verrucomicrobiota bacterium]
ETVTQTVYEIRGHLKLSLLVALLADPAYDSVLVFSRTKHGADRISRKLEASGLKVATLHSNKTQNHRLRSLKAFKAGEVRILVATDIAARGIDVTGISHVINYDFPMTNEDYVHRIGRTGRANAVGDAVSFVCPDEHNDLRSLERFIGRGLPRKRLEGFDYDGAPSSEPPVPPRGPRPPPPPGPPPPPPPPPLRSPTKRPQKRRSPQPQPRLSRPTPPRLPRPTPPHRPPPPPVSQPPRNHHPKSSAYR